MKDSLALNTRGNRIIITAGKGGGKTAAVRRIINYLHHAAIPHRGFYAVGAWEDDIRSSFTLHSVPGGESVPFCDRHTEEWIQYGRFRYNPAALQKGDHAVRRAVPGECIIMDEISLQELRGNLWADTLSWAVQRRENPLILSVQRRYLDDVRSTWKLEDAVVFDGETVPLEISRCDIEDWIDTHVFVPGREIT